MNNLEDKLNQLPKGRLSRKADFKIRLALHFLIWQKKLLDIKDRIILPDYRLAGALAVMVLTVALPVYSYASPSVNQGSFLYPVKQMIEEAEINLALTEIEKEAKLEKMAGRRLEEAQVLSQNCSNQVEDKVLKTVNKAIDYKIKADEETGSLPNINNNTSTDNKIKKIEEKQFTKLVEVASNIGVEADEPVLEAVSLALDEVNREHTGEGKNKESRPETKNNFPVPEEKINESTSTPKREKEREEEIGNNRGTSTPKVSTKENKPKLRVITQDSINQAKQNMVDIKHKLNQENLSQEDIGKLFEKLDEKIEKAQSAFNEGNINQASGLIKSTESISHNAKHFIKKGTSSPENYGQRDHEKNKERQKERKEKNEDDEDD